jgi:putative aldouronate transport system permease protein
MIQAKNERALNGFFLAVLLLFALFCVAPYLLVLAGSFTYEGDLVKSGLRLVPRQWSADAYKLLFSDFGRVATGYKNTVLVTSAGTAISLLVNSMLAYALSKRACKYRGALGFYCYFTMLFSGGIVPWYIVCAQYLGLRNNIWALILPYAASAWYMFLLRNYFKSLPEEIGESATIDGASEPRIFFTIILPLSLPALASVGLFVALMYWNDWWLGIMLTEEARLMPLQLLLRSIVSNIQFMTGENASRIIGSAVKLPSEGIKYAATIITIGPILLLYPFIQKYFVKGLMVGAVKG